MKGITLWQPWAQLSVSGDKLIETRSWYTKYRGQIFIHAAKRDHIELLLNTLTDEELNFFRNASIFNKGSIYRISSLPLGEIVGLVNLIDCKPIHELYGTKYDTPKERALGDWTEGRFGWVMDNPVMFKKPIPARGSQGFWQYNIPLRKVINNF